MSIEFGTRVSLGCEESLMESVRIDRMSLAQLSFFYYYTFLFA